MNSPRRPKNKTFSSLDETLPENTLKESKREIKKERKINTRLSGKCNKAFPNPQHNQVHKTRLQVSVKVIEKFQLNGGRDRMQIVEFPLLYED